MPRLKSFNFLNVGSLIMQSVIDHAVRIATRAAMNGKPVSRVIWIAPTSPTENASGSFLIEVCRPLSASDRAPWD